MTSEANSELTWRDMQHLVIYTSNPNPLDHETGICVITCFIWLDLVITGYI